MSNKSEPSGQISIIKQNEQIQEATTDRFTGEITIEIADGREPRIIGAAVDTEPAEGTGATLDLGHTGRYWWLALLPLVFVVATGAVTAISRVSRWAVEWAPLGFPPVYLFVTILLGLGVIGTFWIRTDAKALRTLGSDWQPDEGRYLGAGAIVLATIATFYVGSFSTPLSRLAGLFLGFCFIGVLVASVVVGPVYLLNRHRHIGISSAGRGD